MKNCNCTEPFYCDMDNLHYPGITCRECQAKEEMLWHIHAETEDMIEKLSVWSGKSVKPLKPKPKHRVVIVCDELPF